MSARGGIFQRSLKRLQIQLPQGDEVNSQLLYRQILANRNSPTNRFKAWTTTRIQNWLVVGGMLFGGAVLLGPWLVEETREALGHNVKIVDPSQLVRTTPEWWENEWRKSGITWRAHEAREGAFVEPFEYIQQITGRNVSDASLSGWSVAPAHKNSGPWWSSLLGRSSGASSAPPKVLPRAFVPLCGDSPVILELIRDGYQVDAVDCSETAIRTCVERLELVLPTELFSKVKLHWKDFFAAALWQKDLDCKGDDKKFKFIYDRQAMSAINLEQRSDYAFLLKQALADDGIIFVEGVFRTGRVKGNKVRGPPYALSRAQLRDLFPEREGFMVQCKDVEDNAVKLLDRESKVLRRVPKELHTTTFPCVVFRQSAVVPPASEAKQTGEQITL